MLRHTKVFWYADSGNFPDIWFHGWTFFAVPVFFFISGFSLTLKYGKSIESLDTKSFYKRRIMTLLPLYLIWSFLYFLIADFDVEPFGFFLLEFIVRTPIGVVLTIWYIFVVFQLYLLYPLILRRYNKLSFKIQQILIIGIVILMLVSYILGDLFTDIVFFYLHFGQWLIYFLIGINIASYWKEIQNFLRKNVYFKIAISILFIVSFATLPYFVVQTYPRKPAAWILNNIITIFFLLMVFSQRRIYVSPIISKSQVDTEDFQPKQDSATKKLNFEGKIFGYFSKFLYINGQFSLGLFLSHRFFMQVASLIFLNIFGLDIDPWREANSRFDAFLISILYFVLVYVMCIIFIYLIWKLPKSKYIVGNKSLWLSIDKREVIKYKKEIQKLEGNK
jgi:peptidoglycan/LPS O-acetylase OafA/YrhL